MKPKLTVAIPNYNHAQYLPQCLDSFLTQSYTDFELIVVDDASTDNSADILCEYAKKDPRVRIIWKKRNGGVVQALNTAIAEAKAPYFHSGGADDVRYPGYLQACMDVLLDKPELGMCWTHFDWGEEEDKKLETCGFEPSDSPICIEPTAAISRLLEGKIKVYGAATIFKTDLARLYGYDPQLTYYSDWYLLNTILLNHPTVIVPQTLCFFRVHQNNFSNVARHNKKIKMATYKHMLDKLNQDRTLKEKFRKSALLTPLFQDMFWKLLFNPKYATFWPYINKRYSVKERISKSLKKKLLHIKP
ncbi:MAG: glycosyltransferase family 2 protein [Chlamydiales bacterium]|nr:glycosyltransferase family 2 protein [Chlamydiales bacterium]